MDMTDIKLYLRSIFLPMRVTLDSNDNSVTINESLFNALVQCGIEKNNNIYAFKAGDKYGFMLKPKDIENTVVSQLQQSAISNTIGFECSCPSINTMMYNWHRPFGTIATNVRVRYRRVGEHRMFIITPPINKQCR